jgi:hypothetical protein
LLLVAVLGLCAAQRPAKSEAERWSEDVAFLGRELPKRHKNAFHHTSKAAFDRSVAHLQQRVPALHPDEVIVGMLQITAAVGDAHTYVRLPPAAPRLPLRLYWFGDELRIIGAAPEHRAALGARVVAIGGHDLPEVMRRVRTTLAQAENEGFILAQSPGYLLRPEILHGLGVVTDPRAVSFTIEDESGRRTFTLAPAPWPPALVPAVEPEPLWRRRPEEAFWFTRLEDGTVYVAFRRYDGLEAHARKLFAFLDANRAERLVIDMRQNSGGDFTKVREHLIPAIRARPTINRPGTLYVVIGRGTLSAAMTNAADFRKLTNAVLAGEPTGERPNSYQEGREMVLPNSRLSVSYSTRYYAFGRPGDVAVEPDLTAQLTWADYKAGGDAVLDLIARQPPDPG